MGNATQSVITLERFGKGKTFQQYLDSGIRNRELFENNYNGLTISAEQKAALQELAARPDGPHHMVVIGEDWCPDVYRGAGVAQKIAEAAGIEMRFFERDQNKDMIAGYLKGGEFESIPVFVIYDKDHNEITHFIERPRLANEQIHVTRDVIGDMSPAAIAARIGHEPSEDEVAAERAKGRDRYMAWQRDSDVWAGWRVATVDEVIADIRAKLG
ncbi:MAG: thioredoxin family protein [Dehalococcoidia bacterium]|uniref:thioredoxin family protein n=1 Tax=Candidatus Amarobacter glycogenicus TaxID=3140699 RepID=UPI001DD6F709|nr:thioredoxin family protein [Dehalococcoidia bacterium]MBK6560211.1 thioredoxin family protein [Dehalococcoidia bacterium]MBK7125811.1 thioredoxin family protein [Dehalococcoidia bacterium]MBK7328693.1 thioredoxin family protein [Dehalococcoidia bacterium]MBK7724179.1 thioredoxin family protein [Dehalococcoidia bacterium]